MRRSYAFAPLVVLLFAAACSRGVSVESEPAPALDPVGTFDFSADVNGETRTGTFVIERRADGLGGYVTIDGEDEIAPMEEVRVDGSHLSFDAMAPGEAFTFDLVFVGDAFTGQVHAPMGRIPVSGSRRAS